MSKTTTLTTTLCTLFYTCLFSACSNATSDYSSDMKKHINFSLANNSPSSSALTLSKSITVPVTYDTTKKGNGTIAISNLVLRIFDQHDDGTVYQNDFLQLATKDLNSDGISELIFTGILKHTGDKETDPSYIEPITAIYSLECKTGHFVKLQQSSNYSITLSNKKGKRITCP